MEEIHFFIERNERNYNLVRFFIDKRIKLFITIKRLLLLLLFYFFSLIQKTRLGIQNLDKTV